MKVLVFAKKRQTKEGKSFTAYVSKLVKKDGSELTAGVKFREDCGAPKAEDCPCYIEFEKKDGNLSTKKFESLNDDGELEVKEQHTLWISSWKKSDEVYVDTSLDDFE
jgi:hypothetical protein